ncbi:hypothetical protein OsJ_08099 [Oryza sativa Japonica Group]|uniref:Uncharacterized protein n=1 Tax=Oryza sativa subsp. japonica TaxID=39947 RepID=B9F218_ORYSJ|nr:hypothetical protein OsJ_08099 [Oryza sativa Japonica Group]
MSIFEDWACKSWRTHHYELRRASSKTGPANPGELTTMSIFEDWAGKSWRIDKSPQALRYRWARVSWRAKLLAEDKRRHREYDGLQKEQSGRLRSALRYSLTTFLVRNYQKSPTHVLHAPISPRPYQQHLYNQ